MSSDEAPIPNLLNSTKKGVQIRTDSYVRYNPLYLVMHGNNDDTMSDYLSLLNMLFSMIGMMMKMKWCAWAAVFVSTVNFTNSRANEENRQILSSFMLSITAVIMSYMQNPQPMTLPFL